MTADAVEISRTRLNQHAHMVRAEFPDGLAIEWEGGAGEALVRAEADMRGLDIHDPEGLLAGTP